MAAEDTLNESMEKAVQHYSSLFQLPSFRNILLLTTALCLGGATLATRIVLSNLDGAATGLLLGSSLLIASLGLDYIVRNWVLKGDVVYGMRRTLGLSLYCWVLWFLFVIAGAITAASFGSVWWVKLSLLGFSAVLILRFLVLNATSPSSSPRRVAASFAQPFCSLGVLISFWIGMGFSVTSSILLFALFSMAVSLASVTVFMWFLNRVGEHTLGVPSLAVFKAFVLNWMAGLNEPFEGFLERMGETRDVEVSIIGFGSSAPKAALIVPSVHPGPFKNIGSSLLPSMLKDDLEKKLGCTVAVPHGLFGHEFDLASQSQTQKVIKSVREASDLEHVEMTATPFIRVTRGSATACCQIFGKSAFVTFTLAPKTTEDLPIELGLFVRQKARELGLGSCAVTNAHNSIDDVAVMQEALGDLKDAAAVSLAEAASFEQERFQIGAATVRPSEFGLSVGMGPGGITVFLVKVGERKTAYVVIDGNNMVSGLREEILSALRSMGMAEGEVFTTDTHSVNAIVLNKRGYHPLGEVMDHARLIGYIQDAVKKAESDLEECGASSRTVNVPGVKVIGARQLEGLCVLIDKSIQRAKKTVVPVFGSSSLFLMLFLAFV